MIQPILLDFFSALDAIDRGIFLRIHSREAHPTLDAIMLALRNPLTWIPLYAFMLYWFYTRMRRAFWPVFTGTLILLLLTDQASAHILKPWIGRLRPCHDEALQPHVRNLLGCGGQFGMPSSHATNHFGLAAYWFMVKSGLRRAGWWWLWIWAFAISYAQVYVGKHYPGDVIVGALLGTGLGMITYYVLRRRLGQRLQQQPAKTADHV